VYSFEAQRKVTPSTASHSGAGITGASLQIPIECRLFEFRCGYCVIPSLSGARDHENTELMKVLSLGCAIAVTLASGGVGYEFGAERIGSGSYLALERTAPLEYYATAESFSEVENTKSSLEALCLRFTTAVRAKRLADWPAHAALPGSGTATEPRLASAIVDLEEGLKEFAGTDQELEVAQDLLLALKEARQSDRWIDVYLKELYDHPTHPVVGRLARDAIGIADQCGRQASLRAALLYLQSVPVEFQGNEKREVVPLQAGHWGQLASHDHRKAQSSGN